MGTIKQARVELPLYDYERFDDPTMDRIRAESDLSKAIAWYRRAIRIDPDQPTALTRLSSIALARGEYDEASAYAVAAAGAGGEWMRADRVVRLVLGDVLVAQGRVDEASSVLRGLVWAQGRLQWQQWYRYWSNGDAERTAFVARAALLLDPSDSISRNMLEQAEKRMRDQ